MGRTCRASGLLDVPDMSISSKPASLRAHPGLAPAKACAVLMLQSGFLDERGCPPLDAVEAHLGAGRTTLRPAQGTRHSDCPTWRSFRWTPKSSRDSGLI